MYNFIFVYLQYIVLDSVLLANMKMIKKGNITEEKF